VSEDINVLAGDLGRASKQVASALFDTYRQAGEAFADDWRANAAETSGVHGRYYPDSIDHEMRFAFTGIAVEVGPNSGKKQGGMGRGFELGSVNQPPHLDGTRALPAAEARLAKLAETTIAYLMP
jgi:hypothetical protein